MGDAIDPAVGIVWRVRAGERVREGEVLAEIHHRGGRGLARAQALLADGVRVGDPSPPTPLVLAHIEA